MWPAPEAGHIVSFWTFLLIHFLAAVPGTTAARRSATAGQRTATGSRCGNCPDQPPASALYTAIAPTMLRVRASANAS